MTLSWPSLINKIIIKEKSKQIVINNMIKSLRMRIYNVTGTGIHIVSLYGIQANNKTDKLPSEMRLVFEFFSFLFLNMSTYICYFVFCLEINTIRLNTKTSLALKS